MKKIFTLTIFIFIMYASATSQVVNEDVHFDYYQNSSDNDLVNHFSSGTGLAQIQTNGITGGCLATPDSIANWGFDNALYCTRYSPQQGDSTFTGICFKYDSTQVNLPSFQRAMSVWLWPNADFNHYIVATVSGNKKLELLTYGWSNNPYPNLALIQNHWYRYALTVVFTGGPTHQLHIGAAVFDLGLSGTASPVIVNSSSGTINDSVLVADTAIHVSVTGTRYGGALYLDDFHFKGRKGSSDCITSPTGILNEASGDMFRIYPSPAVNSIFIERNEMLSGSVNISIYSILGEKLEEIKSIKKKTEIPVSSLPQGIYIVQCRSDEKLWTTKIQVEK